MTNMGNCIKHSTNVSPKIKQNCNEYGFNDSEVCKGCHGIPDVKVYSYGVLNRTFINYDSG